MKIKLLNRADRDEMVKKLATLDESSDEAKSLRKKLEANTCLPKAVPAPPAEKKPAAKPAPKPAAKSAPKSAPAKMPKKPSSKKKEE